MTLALDNRIAWYLRNAGRVAMLTGAGISAESGIPTFRDAVTGFWSQFNPQELGSPAGFAANPQRVWDWYRYRRNIVAGARPNPGHYAVAALETLCRQFTLITQNIDGLHPQAGSRNMLLLHGNIQQMRCSRDPRHPVLDWLPEWDVEGDPIPLCECGAMLRPNVVWFGENLDANILRQAEQTAIRSDVFFSVGTSATVQPAALLPLIAKERGALVIEVNLEPTTLSPVADLVLLGSAAEIMPQVVEVISET